MPNWCENQLYVSGPKHKVDEFISRVVVEANGEQRVSFDAHVPMPPEEQGNYFWRIANWGTKWSGVLHGVDCYDREDGTCEALIVFDTAWSPPDAWLARVAQLEPELSFDLSYLEMGDGFVGRMVYDKGELQSDIYVSVADDENQYEKLVQELFGIVFADYC